MLTRWTSHLTATCSPKTVSSYTNAVSQFIDWHVAHSLGEMNSETLQQYVEDRTSEYGTIAPLSPKSIRLHVSAIREYMKFCGYEPRTPKMPRVPRREGRYLSPQQLTQYNEAVTRIENHSVRTVLLLLPLTGLRIGEALSLTPNHIEKRDDGMWLRISSMNAKNKKGRSVPLVKGAYAVLRTYTARHFVGGPTDRLFGVTDSEVRRRLRGIRDGFDAPWCTPHVLRHTFATYLREHGVPIEDIAEILGHEPGNLRTTMIYAHATDRVKRRAVEQLEGGSYRREKP